MIQNYIDAASGKIEKEVQSKTAIRLGVLANAKKAVSRSFELLSRRGTVTEETEMAMRENFLLPSLIDLSEEIGGRAAKEWADTIVGFQVDQTKEAFEDYTYAMIREISTARCGQKPADVIASLFAKKWTKPLLSKERQRRKSLEEFIESLKSPDTLEDGIADGMKLMMAFHE